MRPHRGGGLEPVSNSDELEVGGWAAPYRVVRPKPRMLAAALDREAKVAVRLDRLIEVGHPVHQMIETHRPRA